MVRLKGFAELMPIDEARSKFYSALQLEKLDAVYVPTEEALGLVTAKPVIAERDSPPFDRSAVDGYALRAKDTFGASQHSPETLRLVREDDVRSGELREIWTGESMPKGADAVIMLEQAEKIGEKVQVFSSLPTGANVSRKAEDIEEGEVVVEEGERLKPQHLGLLASIGIEKIAVTGRPRVALAATGSELVPFGGKFEPHRIIEVNSLILSGMCSELGAEAFSLGIAEDDESEIEMKIREGLARADLVITTGGTSVGLHDLVPKVLEHIEPRCVIVHGVCMRPGMPTALAVIDNKPVIVLSGNPVAAMIGFEVFVRPLIGHLLGAKDTSRIKIRVRLTRRVAGALGRRVFLRVRIFEKDGRYLAEPVRAKGSGIITTVSRADGYVIIPEDREGLRDNEVVDAHLF
ncbi:MAG: molybdopterin molybdotransferase MoeA [Candidatus Bathyarchaeota archaeon]|nr:MAG: molybdopterin molybdotransferase MoeA [Candidatus Bathyarchaeota archaeon]